MKISDIFELENIGYISTIYTIDIYRADLGSHCLLTRKNEIETR